MATKARTSKTAKSSSAASSWQHRERDRGDRSQRRIEIVDDEAVPQHEIAGRIDALSVEKRLAGSVVREAEVRCHTVAGDRVEDHVQGNERQQPEEGERPDEDDEPRGTRPTS